MLSKDVIGYLIDEILIRLNMQSAGRDATVEINQKIMHELTKRL
ncbi:hypothetical protein A1OE_138 [Candidatus Endolissoclinum faulkneri L2]|uniref:Uncharacterized protein n=1 Tax=Candidatus Endolissoclinum faulkneri L2 TaxID=1193729 RepID=K7YLH5_9PROT|nr:hypothetical protein A1OE_138 [Candidatus Endolissoclinum faulkneri L2]